MAAKAGDGVCQRACRRPAKIAVTEFPGGVERPDDHVLRRAKVWVAPADCGRGSLRFILRAAEAADSGRLPMGLCFGGGVARAWEGWPGRPLSRSAHASGGCLAAR